MPFSSKWIRLFNLKKSSHFLDGDYFAYIILSVTAAPSVSFARILRSFRYENNKPVWILPAR